MNLNLTEKHALVCGSTQGIGKACALELCRLGARITLISRNKTTLQQLHQELKSISSQKHDFLCVDFSNPADLQTQLSEYIAQEQASPLHILINNTGGPPGGAITDASCDDFEKAFSQHLLCNHILSQAVLAGMKKATYGRIINIISTSVKAPLNNLGVSNTIRGAVANWAKTLAGEVGKFGITVNNILPGATNTERLQNIIQAKKKLTNQTTEEVVKTMQAAIPAGRFADPLEIAQAVAFLASPSAAYINGINLPVDGGRTPCL